MSRQLRADFNECWQLGNDILLHPSSFKLLRHRRYHLSERITWSFATHTHIVAHGAIELFGLYVCTQQQKTATNAGA